MKKKTENNNLDKFEKRLLILCGILLIAMSISPILFTNSICSRLDFTHTGGIGDTIGGLTSPFVGLIGAILVFITFRLQVKENQRLIKSEDKNYYFELFKKIDNSLDNITFDFTIPRKKKDTRNLIKYILSVKLSEKTKKNIPSSQIERFQNTSYTIKNFAFCISAYLILTKEWEESERPFIKILEIKLRHYRNNLKLKSVETLLRKQLKLNADFLVRHLNPTEKTKMFDIITNRKKLDEYIKEQEKANNTDVNLELIKKIRNNFVYSFDKDLEEFDKIR